MAGPTLIMDMTMSKPADPASSLLDPSQLKSYTQEQVQLLYNGLPLSLISSLIIGLLLSISHLAVVGQAEIIIWNLILGSTLILRLILWQFWLNAGQLYRPELWLIFFRAGACLGGIGWGAAPLLIYANDNSIYQALLSFSLAGLVSGSLTSLSADRFSALGFALLAVCPLTIEIIINNSPTAFAMSVMTILFIIFVISSSGRTQKELRTQIQQNAALFMLSQELQDNRKVDAVVAKVQSQYISDKKHSEAMQTIITDTIEISGSEMGFIGEVFYEDDNKPYLKMLVFDHKNQHQKFDFFYQAANDRQEFRSPNGLFGSILQSGKPLFCGNPRRDIRSIGIPEKHPEIENFVGIPVFQGNRLVAVMCLANANKEYSLDTVKLLTPINHLIAQFIHISHLQKQHKQDIAVLEETTIQTQTILDDIADGIVTINQYGIIKSFNKAAETIFGYKAEQIIGEAIDLLMPEAMRDEHAHKLSEYFKTGKANIIGIGREVTGLRRNGKQFPMDLMVSRIYRNGEPMFIGIIRDISEKKILQESHKNLLTNLAKDLRIPSHAISLALDLIEKNIHSQKHNTSKNLINSAKTQNQQLQHKIQSILNENIDQNTITRSIKASGIIEVCIHNYKHIAELRGSRFSLVNRIYDEYMLINESIFEKAMLFFLSITAENSIPFSEIKIYLEQIRGRVRIYSIKKSEQIDHKLEKSAEWEDCKKLLQTIHASIGIEKADSENSVSDNDIIYMEFPLAMIKAGF
jgi:two-component system, LuxR family, sensor kinase FixL